MLASLHFLVGVTFFAAAWWLAYLVAHRLFRDERPSRWMAVLAFVYALGHGGFLVLGALHLYRLSVAFPVLALATAVGHLRLEGRTAWSSFREDTRAAAALLRLFCESRWRTLALLALAAAACVRLLQGLVSPALAWDTLLYHGYKPARWVHHGHLFRELAPDKWTYLEYFPDAGEVPWGWAFLATGDDSWLALAGLVVWSSLVLAVYGLGRALGAERVSAVLAGLTVASLPAMVTQIASGYVDMFVLLAFLLGASGLAMVEREGPVRASVLAGIGFGLLTASKASGMPIALCGLALLALLTWRLRSKRPGSRWYAPVALSLGLAVAIAGPGIFRTWIETGSPFYPLTVQVAGKVLLRGHEELRMLYAGGLRPLPPHSTEISSLLEAFLVPARPARSEYFGFGPSVLLVLPMAVAALLPRGAADDQRGVKLGILVLALLPVAGMFTEGFRAQRALWLTSIPRLATSAPAAVALLAACSAASTRRWGRLAWISALAINLLVANPPLGWSEGMRAALAELAPYLAVALAVVAIAAYAGYRHPSRLAAFWWVPALGALAFVAAPRLERVRRAYRHTIYAESAAPSGAAFVMHALNPAFTAPPIWAAVDDGPPHRIALAVGWNRFGDNGYRLPLMGARFQNDVRYVPITADGHLTDYRTSDESVGNEVAWLARLRDRSIDVVVLIGSPPERTWVRAHPDLFEEIAAYSDHGAYRFHPERLANP